MENAAAKAIVNGRSVGIGDFAGKTKILSIGDDSVTFGYRGRTFTKRLGR